MNDVLVLTNRKPSFFRKFSREIFTDVEDAHSVSYLDRQGTVVETTVRFLWGLLSGRPDLVWIAGSGFATFFVCLVGRLLPGTTVVFYHNDFTYQFMRDFKAVPRWRLLVERVQEGGPLRLCDVVGTMTPYHEEYLREKGIEKPYFRVQHGVDVEEFRPGVGADVREQMGIGEDELAVGVVGTFNRSEVHDTIYGWTLLEALAAPELDDVPVVGVFVGGGQDLEYVDRRVEQLGIEDRVVRTGYVDHDRLPAYLAALDVTLLVKADHPADKMTTTMKLPEYLAAGTYVVADDHAFAASVLDDEHASLLPYTGIRDDEFPARLASELATLADDPDRVAAGGEYSRQVAEAQFDYDRIRAHVLDGVDAYLAGSREDVLGDVTVSSARS